MAMKTQGSELYVIDPEDGTVINIGCVTSIDGIDSVLPQIPTTCMSSLEAESVGGLPEPGQATFTINFDVGDPTHVRLRELKLLGENLQWALGFRDGWNATTGVGVAPTSIQDSAGDWSFVLPTTRTWLAFEGYMASFPLSGPLSGVWTANVGVQISGAQDLTVKST
jgi:hypothetical protein